MDDSELLRQYASSQSDAAFRQLVDRYINLVYSAALRQVGGDAHRAKDVAQIVFTAMATNARSLAKHPMLVSWLFTTTRNTAAKLVRTETRRQKREQEAMTMQILTRPDEPADWSRISPVLDEALSDLDATDRESILLRFFSGLPLREIGKRLGLTDDSAQKRISRALEKLRAGLVNRGVTSTAAGLALVLEAHAVSPAPAGLASGLSPSARPPRVADMTKAWVGAAAALALVWIVYTATGPESQLPSVTNHRLAPSQDQAGTNPTMELQPASTLTPRAFAQIPVRNLDDAAIVFDQEPEIHLRLIQIKRLADSTDEDLLTKADEIVARFRTGEKFDDLARAFSGDVRAEKGGDWGWLKKSDLKSDFSELAFSLRPGQVSEPILLKEGAFVLFAEERRDREE